VGEIVLANTANLVCVADTHCSILHRWHRVAPASVPRLMGATLVSHCLCSEHTLSKICIWDVQQITACSVRWWI